MRRFACKATLTSALMPSGYRSVSVRSKAAGTKPQTSTRKPRAADDVTYSGAVLQRAATIFDDMAEVRSLEGELFRATAYAKAAAALRTLLGAKRHEAGAATDDAGVSVSATELKLLNGFGAKMAVKVAEIAVSADQATLQEHSDLMQSPLVQSSRFIMSVHGFGPKAAIRLARSHNGALNSVDALQAVAEDEGFTHAQRLGLRYHAEATQRIPRDEMHRHRDLVTAEVAALDGGLQLEICGSYRRELASSGDVDCLLTSRPGVELPSELHGPAFADGEAVPKAITDALPTNAKGQLKSKKAGEAIGGSGPLAHVLARLVRTGYVVDVLGHGPTKVMAYSRLPHQQNSGSSNGVATMPARRLDIRWVEPQQFPAALLYFTGSAAFNARMRGVALAAGYTLNEYGLYTLAAPESKSKKKMTAAAAKRKKRAASDVKSTRGETLVPVTCERDIFDRIGMPYVEPKDRKD